MKEHTNLSLVDKEVVKFATDGAIEIDKAANKCSKRMIDKRVLVVMMITYLIQTLDKGALSFASIMGIMKDAHLEHHQVRIPQIFPCGIFLLIFQLVFMADHYRLHLHSRG